MDTKKCMVLLTVMEQGNISEAANLTGYTPSGVSRMIESVEKEIGFPLFIRTHDGVIPTSELKTLLPIFQEMASLDKTLTEYAQDIIGMKRGKIRIGNAYAAYMPYLFDAVLEFQKDFPGIDIQIREGLSSELIHQLLMNELDLCICSQRPGNFDWIPLLTDHMAVMVNKDHPLAGADSYPLTRFEQDIYIDFCPESDTDAKRTLKKADVHPNTHYIMTDNYSAYLMVKAGMGVTLTNSIYTSTWSEGIAALTPSPAAEISIGIAALNRQYLGPSVRTFIKLVERRFKDSRICSE